MGTGGIILTVAIIAIAASSILALVFRLWPRYGSVEAAIDQSNQALDKLEPASPH